MFRILSSIFNNDRKVSNRFFSSRLGHKIDLKGRKISDLNVKEFYNEIAGQLWEHGVICVKNQNMTLYEYISVVNRLGNAIRLPPQLAFNAKQPEFPEIARVGNVAVDGAIMKQYTAAEYWHTDGQFWPEPKNFIVNWLYSKFIPSVGGETGFLDMRNVYNHLIVEDKLKFSKTNFTIMLKDIKDFKNVNPTELGFNESTSHSTIFVNPFTLKPALYLGSVHCILEYEDGTTERAERLIHEYIEKHGIYVHKWEEGDILLWDNSQVMHKGMGGYFEQARLLFRAQSMVLPFNIELIKQNLV